MSISKKIDEIKNSFNSDCKLFNNSKTSISIEDIKNKYLGRRGLINSLYSLFNTLSKDEKSKYGLITNKLKNEISDFINIHNEVDDVKENIFSGIDLTLPGKNYDVGSLHPITIIIDEIKNIFERIGFSSIYGPEVDTDYYNFEALNIPEYHPARDMQDTFYIDDSVLLRTHTSSSQIHHMLKNKPPIRIISPGKVYRNEDISVRSYCMFHQIEGLYVDEKVSFSDLKGTLEHFAKEFFGSEVKTRFRPSYFPFTEPSAEMDVYWGLENESDYRITKGTGWLEILGCGMVNKKVFDSVEYDKENLSGFAFGLGIERIAMLKYGIDDIRLLYNGNLNFLRQFK